MMIYYFLILLFLSLLLCYKQDYSMYLIIAYEKIVHGKCKVKDRIDIMTKRWMNFTDAICPTLIIFSSTGCIVSLFL